MTNYCESVATGISLLAKKRHKKKAEEAQELAGWYAESQTDVMRALIERGRL
jgi:hypothetical protein